MKFQEIDKRKAFSILYEGLNDSATNVNGLSRNYSKDATEWPSHNESHSDTNRSQLQDMSAAARRQAVKIEGEVALFEGLRSSFDISYSSVDHGALFMVQFENQDVMTGAIIPGTSTVFCDYEGTEICGFGEEAALSQAVLGLSVGNQALVNGKKVTILAVK